MKSVFLHLAMPPAGLVWLIVVGLLLAARWPRAGRVLAWIGVLTLLVMGMPAFSTLGLHALEAGLPTAPSTDQAPQAIIVLGAEVIRAPDESLGARPGLLTLDRLRTAAALQRRTGLPVLVTGGTTQSRVAPVGVVMAQSLRTDFNVPVRWVEAKSADTWENARFSTAILRPEGISSVYVVTHAWHMRRALLAFQGTGLTVTAAPTPPDAPLSLAFVDLLPRPSGWQAAYYALHEWIGYVYYQLR